MNTSKEIWGEDAKEFKCVLCFRNRSLFLTDTAAQIGGNPLQSYLSLFRVYGATFLLFSAAHTHALDLNSLLSSKFTGLLPWRAKNNHRSLFRLKALLFVLVKAFEFDLAEPVENFYNGVS